MAQALMAQAPLFQGLTDDELTRLEASCRALDVRAGDVIFQEGDPGDTLLVLLRGRVRIYKSLSIGVDKTLVVVGPGEIFGEISLTDGGPRSACAEAVLDCQALSLAREDLFALVDRDIQLATKLFRRLAETISARLRATNDLLRDACDWGLQLSGATALNLHEVVAGRIGVDVWLAGGLQRSGRILRVEQSRAGWEVTLEDGNGRLHVIPYHAILDIQVGETAPPLV